MNKNQLQLFINIYPYFCAHYTVVFAFFLSTFTWDRRILMKMWFVIGYVRQNNDSAQSNRDYYWNLFLGQLVNYLHYGF